MTSGGSSLGLEAPEVSPLSRPLSKLCATCTTAFQGLTEDSYGFNRRFTVEGQSMEKFRQAVKDQCFICYRVWRSDISMLPKSLRHLTKKCWRPLTYYFEKPLEEEEPLMKAIVYFGDLGGGFLHPDQFYATPSFVGYHWKGRNTSRCMHVLPLDCKIADLSKGNMRKDVSHKSAWKGTRLLKGLLIKPIHGILIV